eukprot:2911273-Amphidinium_carterae.1
MGSKNYGLAILMLLIHIDSRVKPLALLTRVTVHRALLGWHAGCLSHIQSSELRPESGFQS